MPELKETILNLLNAHSFLTFREIIHYVGDQKTFEQIREALRLLSDEQLINVAIDGSDPERSLVGLASQCFVPPNSVLR